MNNLVMSTTNTDDFADNVADHVVDKIIKRFGIEKFLETGFAGLPVKRTPMFVEGAAKFCGMAKQTFYQKTSEIPHHRIPGTKRLIFFEDELLDYIKNSKENSEPVGKAVPVPTKPRRRSVINKKR